MEDDARPQIMTHALALVFLSIFGATTGFYLLLSAVPLYATTVGAGGIGAGLSTGALMLSTVVAELATPRLVVRFGYRPVFAAGLMLLGAPALALAAASNMATILVVCLIRGLGFGITVVVGSALVASLVPQQRRGEGLGIYGVIVGVPSVVALPLGVWLAGYAGYPPVFVAGALAALAGLTVVAGLPGRQPQPDQPQPRPHQPQPHQPQPEQSQPEQSQPEQSRPERPLGVLTALRTPALIRPSIVFSATTMAAGIVVTFLPLAVTDASGGVAAVALLAQAATATVTRWWAGRYGDRHGTARLLVPALLAAALGILALVMTGSATAVIVGAVLFGAGFGVTQNVTLALMFDHVRPSGYGTVSAVWNLAYDAGLGLGAAGFGVLATQTGYPGAFAVTAALMLAALAPAWRDRADRTS